MTALSAHLGAVGRPALVTLAGAATLATGAWFWSVGADEPTAAPAVLAGLSRERPIPANGFLSASPFDPQRRPVDGVGNLAAPPPPAVASLPVTEPDVPLPSLSGILVEGGAHRAMFAGEGQWHGVGGTVAGWTVSAIEAERVTLKQGRRSLVLRRDDAFRR